MFKLTIECSKDIKRLTLDFEDSTHSVAEFSDFSSNPTVSYETAEKAPAKEDFMDRLSNVGPLSQKPKSTTSQKASAPVPVPDLENRPPLVDDGFNDPL